MDTTDFIRNYQIHEGYEPCFRAKKECGQIKCAWRIYCLEKKASDDYLKILQAWMTTEK